MSIVRQLVHGLRNLLRREHADEEIAYLCPKRPDSVGGWVRVRARRRACVSTTDEVPVIFGQSVRPAYLRCNVGELDRYRGLASYFPARKATKIDRIERLRAD